MNIYGERKENTWIDWLIDKKHRWESQGISWWKIWFRLTFICLCVIALFVVVFFLIKSGNKLRNKTMLPFDSGEINYIKVLFVLDVVLCIIVFISKKVWEMIRIEFFNFFLLMVYNLLPSYFLLGILSFTILYPNSSYGEKEAINQRAIFTGKVRRVSRSNSVFLL